MKTRLLLLACLFVLGVGRSEGAILFASGTIERLSVTDYQLEMYAMVSPTPDEFPKWDWDYFYPRQSFIAVSGNFSPSPSWNLPDFSNPLSVVIQPQDPTLFLNLYCETTWVFEKDHYPGGPERDFIFLDGSTNFFATLPQEIGTSSVLTQTPEASSFVLLALGLLPLGLSLTRKPKILPERCCSR